MRYHCSKRFCTVQPSKVVRDILYPEPIVRPLPKPPELIDKAQPKQSTKLDSNVDFEENSSHPRRHYFGNLYKSGSNLL